MDVLGAARRELRNVLRCAVVCAARPKQAAVDRIVVTADAERVLREDSMQYLKAWNR